MSEPLSMKDLVKLYLNVHPLAVKGALEPFVVKSKVWPDSALWQPAFDFRDHWIAAPDDWVCCRVALKDLDPPTAAPAPAPDTLATVLTARGKEYGDFGNFAVLVQLLKHTVRKHRDVLGMPELATLQQEGLDMVLHKIGRIVNGNPDNVDSWQDIAGYATCVADRLKPDAKED